MLKKTGFILLVAAQLISSTAIAGVKGPEGSNGKPQYNMNPIYIHNNTNGDLAYQITGDTPWNNVYGVGKGGTDVYHAGNGDEFAYVQTGVCNSYQFPDVCNSFGDIKPCNNMHYDMNYVASVTVNADMSCSVQCTDGGNSSCKR